MVTSSRKLKSTLTTPSPLHFGQAPSELKLKRAGEDPVASANSRRTASNTPT